MKMSDLRIAFFGTPDTAVLVLDELKKGGILPTLVVTQPDRPLGRKLIVTPPPVKVWARLNEIEVLQPENLKDKNELDILINSEWSLFIVVAYNNILPAWLLDIPKFGTLNVHPSLLPKLRGPSPIRTAIRDNVKDAVGVSIIDLDAEMDHGPIVAQANFELPVWPEKGSVLDSILFHEGGRLLVEVIPKWVAGEIEPEIQNHNEATYTCKYTKADGEIDITEDGKKNFHKYCAHDGWPGTFFFTLCRGERVRVKVTDACFKDGTFTILKVIPEGKKEIDYAEWKKACLFEQ